LWEFRRQQIREQTRLEFEAKEQQGE
jgi:hypothetical protein